MRAANNDPFPHPLEIRDALKTREALIEKLGELQIRINELEGAEVRYIATKDTLRESEQQFRNLAEQSPNMIFINRNGRIVYANRRSCEVMGYTREEYYSHKFDFTSLIAAEYVNIVKENLRSHMVGKEVAPFEYTLITRDGRRIEAMLTTKLIRYNGDRAVLGTITDLTERKDIEDELRQSLERTQRILDETVNSLALMVEKRDSYTAGHQRRVSKIACAVAREMGLPKNHVHGIRIGGILHDVGKVSVPVEIVSKPGPLTDTEFAIIKTHCQVGYSILSDIEFPWPVAEIVLQHHERLDGSGYPKGLVGEDILLEARILSIADVVEAMCSRRPYRPALTIEDALKEIRGGGGVIYDQGAADACCKIFKDEEMNPR